VVGGQQAGRPAHPSETLPIGCRRAQEVRALAKMVNDMTARETILKIADDYDWLAKHAERRPIR
jgi:hypothetical protein